MSVSRVVSVGFHKQISQVVYVRARACVRGFVPVFVPVSLQVVVLACACVCV